MRVSSAVGPSDVIEEIFVRDIVDYIWEILRLRRLKASYLNSGLRQELRKALDQYAEDSAADELHDDGEDGDDDEAEDTADGNGENDDDDEEEDDDEDDSGEEIDEDGHDETGRLLVAWAKKRPVALKKINAALEAEASSIDDVTAQTYSNNMNKIERFSQMLILLEERRNSVLREIDRHRAEFKPRLARAKQLDRE